MKYTIICPHCDYEIKRRTFGAGKCRRCGARYWMSGNDASFGKPKKTCEKDAKN